MIAVAQAFDLFRNDEDYERSATCRQQHRIRARSRELDPD